MRAFRSNAHTATGRRNSPCERPGPPGDSDSRCHTDRRCGRGSRRCGKARRRARAHAPRQALIGKAVCRIGVDRTGFQARFFDTCVAKVNRLARFLKRDLVLEQQRAAIGVPEPIVRMHEDAERRRLQPFGPHRPLLERQIGPVGRRNGARTECLPPTAPITSRDQVSSGLAMAWGCVLPPAAGNAATAQHPPAPPAARIWRQRRKARSARSSPAAKVNPPRRMRPSADSAAAMPSIFPRASIIPSCPGRRTRSARLPCG